MCASISCGRPVMIIVSGTLLPLPVLCVLRFVFTFRWASLVSVHLVVVAILFVSGALMVSLLLSSMVIQWCICEFIVFLMLVSRVSAWPPHFTIQRAIRFVGFLLECLLSYLLVCACLVCLLVCFGVVRLFLFSLNAGPCVPAWPFCSIRQRAISLVGFSRHFLSCSSQLCLSRLLTCPEVLQMFALLCTFVRSGGADHPGDFWRNCAPILRHVSL